MPLLIAIVGFFLLLSADIGLERASEAAGSAGAQKNHRLDLKAVVDPVDDKEGEAQVSLPSSASDTNLMLSPTP